VHSAVKSNLLLAIETSCDETAVAILRGNELLASEVASQKEHEAYGGVVPEVASRNHLLHAPRLLEDAVKKAGISLKEVDAFAATSGPGLASSLMIGASMAKGLALGFAKPYLAINHLEGHLLSPFFAGAFEVEPNVSLIVSGGHTLLVEVRAMDEYRILGRTVDDAAGEAFDKVAKMLGLGYPGGPEIERRALTGDAARFDFPRSMLDSGDHNFSFSGLKTAVRYQLAKLPAISDEVRDDLCASFQRAVVEVLVKKTVRAAREGGVKLVTVSGGVSCNAELRKQMSEACNRAGLRFRTAVPELCTDNAAMIAFAASLRLGAGFASELAQEIDPNLALV
jgi:tRNA N6-adenosine threonylcarbamoyltransferase